MREACVNRSADLSGLAKLLQLLAALPQTRFDPHSITAMSSSSGGEPIGNRFGLSRRGAKSAQLSDSEESLPEWVKQHTSPYPNNVVVISSDGDSDADNVKQKHVAEEPAGPSEAAAEHKTDGAVAGPSGTAPKPAPAKQGKPELGSQQEPASGAKPVAEKTVAALAQVSSNEIPVMLPEKLVRAKVIVELEPTDGGATDLAGDAGAVGRFLVAGPSGEEEIKIDLKGVMYQASVVPMATTLCVVSTSATEAKVEAIFTDFMQLRQDFSNAQARQAEGLLDSWLLADDDDNYVGAGEGGDADGAGDAAAGKQKGKRAKQGADGVKRKPAARKLAPKGGVAKRKAPAKKPGPKAGARGAKKK